MTATVKRLPTLFRWSAQDGLGANGKLVARSYRTELEGVFTRAGQKWVTDRNGLLIPVAHSKPAFSWIGGAEALLLEPATTNYLLYSQDFSNAAWSKSNVTVTANAIAAPDGTMTADKVEATAAGATNFTQAVTTIATTAATYSIYARMGSGATEANKFLLYNATTAAQLASCTIDYSTGILTVASGTCVATRLGTSEWFRIDLTATTGITSGDDLTAYGCFTGGAEGAGEFAYLWQADLVPDAVPSSPIPTTSAAVARVADSLYFPFTLAPQEMTVYVAGVNRGAYLSTGATKTILQIGGASVSSGARFSASNATNGAVQNRHNNGSTGVASGDVLVPTPVFNDVVEARHILRADGSTVAAGSVDGATEVVAAASAANALASAWAAERLYLTGGLSAENIPCAYSRVVVALGTKTMDEMRALAESA